MHNTPSRHQLGICSASARHLLGVSVNFRYIFGIFSVSGGCSVLGLIFGVILGVLPSCAQANRFNRVEIVDYVRSYTPDTANVGTNANRFRSVFGSVVDLKTGGAAAAVYVRTAAGAGKVVLTDNAGDGNIVANDAAAVTFFSATPVQTTIASTFTDIGSLRPIATSTYSLGSTVRRWTNFFSDNAVLTTGFRLTAATTAGWVLTTDALGNGTWQASGSGTSPPFADTAPLVKNVIDPTKQLAFLVSGITTGTTRVWTAQDASLTVAGIDLSQTWTATQNFQAIQPSATSTYSLGATFRRWTNFFTDRIVMTSTAGTGMGSDFVPAADVTFNIGAAAYRFNLIYGRAMLLKSSASPAIFNINDAAGNLLFSQSDAGGAAGDFRIYNTGIEKFSVYPGNTNIKTTFLNIESTVSLTGTIQPSLDNAYNYGNAAARGRFAYFRRGVFDEIQAGGSLGITVSTTSGTCVHNFTSGVLTSTAGVC